MFDIPPAIETYCGTEVAEIVQYVDPHGINNKEKIDNIYEITGTTNIINPCQDSLMAYFVYLIDGKQSDDYINQIIELMSYSVVEKAVTPSIIELIRKKVPLIKYQYTDSFAANYFFLLIQLNYPVTDEIRQLNLSNDNQILIKNEYLAHMGNQDALEYLRTYMKNINDPYMLRKYMAYLLNINKTARDSLLLDYINDERLLEGVTPASNTTIGKRARHYIENWK